MQHSIKGFTFGPGGLENAFELGPVGQLPLDEFDPFRRHLAPAVAKIVKDDRLMSLTGQ